jgi:prepilin-type processing-associated H-X9-DG protein
VRRREPHNGPLQALWADLASQHPALAQRLLREDDADAGDAPLEANDATDEAVAEAAARGSGAAANTAALFGGAVAAEPSVARAVALPAGASRVSAGKRTCAHCGAAGTTGPPAAAATAGATPLAAATSGALDGAPAGKKLRRCTRCKAAWFCADSSCQRLGWLAHKAACDQAAAAAAARCTSAAAAAAARAAKAQGPGRREVSCQADAEAAWAAHRELGRRTEAANALFLGGHVREALNAYEAAASAAADAASLAAAAAELAADKYAAAAAQAARAAADACCLLQVRHYRLCCLQELH